MITTKLITPKEYWFKTKSKKNERDTEAMKDYPKEILEIFSKPTKLGSSEKTTLDWEINQYISTIKGQELIDIKFQSCTIKGNYDISPHIDHFALVITDDHNHEEVK